jgi:hypothetical protein
MPDPLWRRQGTDLSGAPRENRAWETSGLDEASLAGSARAVVVSLTII